MTITRPKTKTAAELRAEADRLERADRDRENAERARRRAARLAKATEMLGSVADAQLWPAYKAAERDAGDTITSESFDVGAYLTSFGRAAIAQRVHAAAVNYLVQQVHQASGRPMRGNLRSADSPAYVRPLLDEGVPRLVGGGGASVLDGALSMAAGEAARRKVAELEAVLVAAESDASGKPPVDAMPLVTFRAARGLRLGYAEFRTREGRDGLHDLGAFYCSTTDAAVIGRLRAMPDVEEVQPGEAPDGFSRPPETGVGG